MPEEMVIASAIGMLLGAVVFLVLARQFAYRLDRRLRQAVELAKHGPDALNESYEPAEAPAAATIPPAPVAAAAVEQISTTLEEQLAHDISELASGLEMLVKDVEGRMDGRLGEMDGLIAQARKELNDIRQQSAVLMEEIHQHRSELVASEAAGGPIWDFPAQRASTSAAQAMTRAQAVELPSAEIEHAASEDEVTLPGSWPIPPRAQQSEQTPRNPATEGVFVGDRHRAVIERLDKDMSAVEIARELGLDMGEIELIASLHQRKLAGK